jgi:hypothetical protein
VHHYVAYAIWKIANACRMDLGGTFDLLEAGLFHTRDLYLDDMPKCSIE